MKIKNFIGLSFQDAVQNAKAELGEEISILESKKVDNNGSLPGVKHLIQISVVDTSENSSPEAAPNSLSSDHINFRKSQNESPKNSNKQTTKQKQEGYNFSADEAQFLYGELEKLNKYIRKFYLPKYPEDYIDVFEGLKKIGVETEDAKQIIKTTYSKLSSGEQTTKEKIINEIRRQIFPMLSPYHITLNQSNTPLPIALIGPSGSGKTRTIMKLATHPDFFANRKRQIISTGNFGVGTESALEKFSNLTGIGVNLLKSPREIPKTINKYSDEDILFFDTPALSIAQSDSIRSIYRYLDKINQLLTLLVVDATRDILDAKHIYNKYSYINIDGIIITKLDETPRIGKVLSLINKIDLPLFAICEGQSIPDNIRRDFKEVIWKEVETGIKETN
ncbi:MAG: hypothetical protein K9M80_07270 [Candidatus Marinimicrobia bacterium]|nr:hypothetical protein [Candidatus Neomarinimicrobiota bacterium]